MLGLSVVIPPGEPPINPAGQSDTAFSAPCMWDTEEWASPTPCCLRWVVRKIAEVRVLGRLEASCPACGKAWSVLWDPWRPQGQGHAVWSDISFQ